MRLKKLELYGFKSFADATAFDFEPGVTGVVGPNGCGKSNVVDAIKWILGEQSARSLRGKEMMDVIFNGSGSRKSLGYAEASLLFEDLVTADGKHLPEVMVTRRLYRSGESEYMINREGARLRDIKELFLDTGVGMQAYSIIEQGRIDAILTRSAHERRAIFEEAAGVSRYKKKRLEAERKLERTDGNLLRVGDRIEEVERRLRTLKGQATKARRYQELDARLKELRVRHSLHQYAELRRELEELTVKLAELQAEVDAKREAAELYEQDVLDQEARVREIESQIEDLVRARNEIDLKIAQAGSDMAHGQAMIEQIEETRSRHEAEITSLAEKSATDAGELEGLRTELAQVEQGLETTRKDLEATRSEDQAMEAGVAERRREAEELTSQRSQLERERSDLSNRLTQLQAQAESVTGQRARLEAQVAELETQIAQLKEEREAQDAEISRIAESIGEMTKHYHDREEETRAAEARLEELGAEVGRASELYHSQRSRRDLLEGLVERHEGMERGVREVLRTVEAGNPVTAGVSGLVAEIVQTDPEHYAAVEAALEHHADSVVCRDDHAAGAVGRYLGLRESGRSKLLAASRLRQAEREAELAEMRGRVLAHETAASPRELRSLVQPGVFRSDGARKAGGVYELAADGRFVRRAGATFTRAAPLDEEQSRAQAGDVLDSLLGDVLLVEDLRAAHDLARRMPQLRFVTPEGDLASGASLAVAGVARRRRETADAARSTSHSLVAQENELRLLRERVEEQSLALESAKAARNDGAASLARLEGEMQQLRSEIYDANIEHTEKRAAFKHYEEVIGTRRSQLEELKEGMLAATDELERLKASQDELGEKLRVHNENLRQSEERAQSLVTELRELEEKRHGVLERMRGLELSQTRAGEQTASLSRAMRGLEAAIAERKSRMDRLRAEEAESAERIVAARSGIAEAEEKKRALGEERGVLENRVTEVTASRDRARARIDEIKAEQRSARETVEKAGEELADLRMRESEARVHRDSLVERVRDEYGLELDALLLKKLRERAGNSAEVEDAAAEGEAAERTAEELGAEQAAGAAISLPEDFIGPPPPQAAAPAEGGAEAPAGDASSGGSASEEAGATSEAEQPVELPRATTNREEPPQLQTARPKPPPIAELSVEEREALFMQSEGDEDWDAIDREIQDLKKKMSGLGSVNIEAIQEFDEVEERYREMASQRDDLTDAKAKLESLIEELNTKSRDLFLSTLETVTGNFRILFKKLFGGGSGDVVLGEGDPLDAGIDIIAKPPGKEPASISLLSGGEKSMTAVALLFALFKSRPSPFCILDEVDAALDEANVTRFVSMLKEFLAETQFIIITHNKRTMSVADAIHGVTMQESGVSKRISVKFEEVA